jgi:hypothetical protein
LNSPIRLSKDTSTNILLYQELKDPHFEEKLTAIEARMILGKNKPSHFINVNEQASQIIIQ